MMKKEEQKRIAEAKKCNSCLEWHKHCNAECCSLIFIHSNLMKLYTVGEMLNVDKTLSVDERWYFKLRGVKCLRKQLRFPKKHIYIQHNDKNILLYKRKCDYLLPNNKCKGHPDKKPRICQKLTNAIVKGEDLSGIELTYNCLYRYKNLEETKDVKKNVKEKRENTN